MQIQAARSYEWRWFEWVAICTTVAALAPRASHLLEINTLAIWVLMVALCGGAAFVLGHAYGRFKIRGRAQR